MIIILNTQKTCRSQVSTIQKAKFPKKVLSAERSVFEQKKSGGLFSGDHKFKPSKRQKQTTQERWSNIWFKCMIYIPLPFCRPNKHLQTTTEQQNNNNKQQQATTSNNRKTTH